MKHPVWVFQPDMHATIGRNSNVQSQFSTCMH